MRPVTTAKDMLEAVQETLPETDILIKAVPQLPITGTATVADQKIKKARRRHEYSAGAHR